MQINGEPEDSALVGGDDGLAEVLGLVNLAASSDAPVLITGETGTGKNLVAKAIHERSAAAVGSVLRKDLYFRLSVIRIHLPPLRDRRQDIPALCRHLLKESAGKAAVMLPDSELQKLVEYDWPGNVRELKNVPIGRR